MKVFIIRTYDGDLVSDSAKGVLSLLEKRLENLAVGEFVKIVRKDMTPNEYYSLLSLNECCTD